MIQSGFQVHPSRPTSLTSVILSVLARSLCAVCDRDSTRFRGPAQGQLCSPEFSELGSELYKIWGEDMQIIRMLPICCFVSTLRVLKPNAKWRLFDPPPRPLYKISEEIGELFESKRWPVIATPAVGCFIHCVFNVLLRFEKDCKRRLESKI